MFLFYIIYNIKFNWKYVKELEIKLEIINFLGEKWEGFWKVLGLAMNFVYNFKFIDNKVKIDRCDYSK